MPSTIVYVVYRLFGRFEKSYKFAEFFVYNYVLSYLALYVNVIST